VPISQTAANLLLRERRPVAPRPMKPSLWRGIAGFASYYLLRLPYIAYKAWREWH
jgi:hypothetical protein